MSTTPHQEVILTLPDGMSDSLDPLALADTQYAFGVNIVNRGGITKSRPGFRKLVTLTGDPALFQGFFVYQPQGRRILVYGLGGYILAHDMASGVTTNHGLLLSPLARRLHFCQAKDFLIIQDGVPGASWAAMSWPVILDGDALYSYSVSISDHLKVPKGAGMAYVHGRIFVSVCYIYDNSAWTDNLGFNGFVAGDISKGYDRDAHLMFTEEEYLNEGGRIEVPAEFGEITWIGYQKNIPSGTGLGSLVVMSERGCSGYQINAPRSQWKDIDLGQVFFYDSGSLSPGAVVWNNADVLYRSESAVRSLVGTTEKSQSASLDTSPISGEIDNLLALDDDESLELVSMAIHDSRLFVACAPNESGSAFQALAVCDFLPASSIRGAAAPSWESVWTGFEILQVGVGRYGSEVRSGLLVLDSSLNLFLLDRSLSVDSSGAANTTPECVLVTKSYSFGDPFAVKEVGYVDLWLGSVLSDLEARVYYRPHGYPNWIEMDGSASLSVDGGPTKLHHVRFAPGKPAAYWSNEKFTNTDYAFQYLISIKGAHKIERVRFMCQNRMSHDIVPAGAAATALGDVSEAFANSTKVDLFGYRIST